MRQKCQGKTWRWFAAWSCIVVAVAAMNLAAAATSFPFARRHEPQPVLHTIGIPGSIHLTNVRLQKFSQAIREDNSQPCGIAIVYGANIGAPSFSRELDEAHAAYSAGFHAAILRNRAPPFR